MSRRGLAIDTELFTVLLSELARRGGGHRESGAFLLSSRQPSTESSSPVCWPAVTAIAYYDDLDPRCLTGGITFTAEGYTELNALCRGEGLRVVGDIHTHPHGWVHQSSIDSSHPMAAFDGHVALIAPHYATGVITPADLGAHVFHPAGWNSYFGADVATVLRVIGQPRTTALAAPRRLRATLSRVRRLITYRRKS
jgi:proteasome lid subunit RPN8/RPN11